MANVSLREIKKRYGDTAIIHGIDLDISDGEFVVLVGPSGCGKSTLLRMVAGLEEITEGEIHIGGRVVNQLSPRDRNVAMVFQNYALYPHMTVADNMSFALRIARHPPEEIARRVERAAGMLGLSNVLERYPKALSGGQRQRVAMGRAIVRNAEVFLFDEPLSNLDAKLRVQMRADIKALHQEIGTTSIYVTHDQIEAMTMADRIVVLHNGMVEQVGTPLELYDQPANKFVAGFIGSPSMNFLEAQVRMESDNSLLLLKDGQLLPVPHVGRDGEQVWLGIRPEHLTVVPEGGLSVAVRVIEPTGANTHLNCLCGDTELVAVVPDRINARPGDMLHLAPRHDALHLFDHSSEKRLSRLA